jgi:hypothetical protein
MLKKVLIALILLGVSVSLVYFVYPTHPTLLWVLLGICWVCYRLGLRAQRLFRSQSEGRNSPDMVSRTPR